MERCDNSRRSQEAEADKRYRSMTMTCTADDCGHRSTHEFTKRSYEKGIVIVQCPSCKNRYVALSNLSGLLPWPLNQSADLSPDTLSLIVWDGSRYVPDVVHIQVWRNH